MRCMRLKCLGIFFVIVCCIYVIPKTAAAQDNIPFSVVSNGGAELAGGGYSISSTVGQSFVGTAGNSVDVIGQGFWYLQNTTLTGVNSRLTGVAKEFMLYQNYPNPFNPTTVISYQLSAVSNVTFKVYDILGREVATLVNEKQSAGNHSVTFDGSRLASGVYLYRLEAGSFVSVKKLLLLK